MTEPASEDETGTSLLGTLLLGAISSMIGTLVPKFSGLVGDSEFTVAQFAVTLLVLFAVSTVSAVAPSLRREDARYVLVLSLVTAIVAVYQWT